ncbi:hypothetical protein EGJ86_19295 [Pseudomonas sp. o96-267]|uniref:Rmf/CrpP family protein n=1 Tax=Pseudomonas sp. o96-267 TaxID=2479853 RepID=UPI000F7AE024|nr:MULTISPECIES: Rmf/CrpP family protein [Pseudomonas]MDH0959086.1 hypothetical protein [Pseudomonas chengduensis]MDV5863606.1 hypothetical protein [Pseudomonas mendocina]RRV31719.1 hypothetical protein EGJ86_19295 [Pseudomonas sp. o96-267]
MAVDLPIPAPSGFDCWNRSLQGAFKKGVLAFLDGKPVSDCPYRDKRKDDGRLSWSRSYITAWHSGYQHCQRQQEAASE